MPEAYRPGLPVLSDEERARRNALQQEWSNPFTDGEQRPSMQMLREDDPNADELIAGAKSTLASANDFSTANSPFYVPLEKQQDTVGEAQHGSLRPISISKPGAPVMRSGAPATTENFAPEPEYTNRDVLESALGVASFAPGPIGLGARAATSAMGAYDLATEGPSLGNVAQTAAIGFDAIPAIRALRKGAQAKAGYAATRVGRHGPENAPFEGPRRMPEGFEMPSAASGYYDEAAQAGRHKLGPEKSLEDILGSPSIASLRDDIAEGSGRGSVDLTDALNGLGEAPLSPADIARARTAHRFGRSFRSEATAEPAAAAGPKVRAFSEGEEAGIANSDAFQDFLHGSDRVLGPGGRYMSPEEAERLKKIAESLMGGTPPPSALRTTAREAVELSDADRAMLREGGAIMRVGPNAKDPEALLNKKWDDWVNAGEGVDDGPIPFPSKAEYEVQGMPATEYNKPVFGGASFGTEGTFGKVVGPKDRTPIDLLSKMSDEDYARFAREMGLPPRPSVKPKARRGEGDDAIQWNRP